MIEPDIRRKIEDRLRAIERDYDATILFAAESGSRTWGFPSPDSDYDIRFVYRHSSDWYLSVVEERDVIEEPIDANGLDVGGWDVRKAVRLFLRSNPALYEWLVSPIVYREDGGFRSRCRDLSERYYSRRAMAMHCRNATLNQLKHYMKNKTEVRLKKYFYAIRPLCAILWMREREGSKSLLPPMNLPQLLSDIEIPNAVKTQLDELFIEKDRTSELGTSAPIEVLDNWIADTLADLEDYCGQQQKDGSPLAVANAFFRECVGL